MQQYTYVFNALCDYAKCDFLDITQEMIKAYFNRKDGVMKSTDYNLSVLRAIARYMDENADVLQIRPEYLNLFSVVDVIFPDMQFRLEDLPELADIDKVLAYFKSEGGMTGFLSCYEAAPGFRLRCFYYASVHSGNMPPDGIWRGMRGKSLLDQKGKLWII